MWSIGVDFGSLNTRLALLDPSKKMPVIIRNNLSNESTATCIALVPGEARTFGDNATAKEVSRPTCAVGDLASWIQREPETAHDVGDVENLSATRAAAFFLSNVLKFVPADKKGDALVCMSVPSSCSSVARTAIKSSAIVAGVDATKLMLVDSSEAALVYLHHLQRASLPTGEGAAPVAVVIADIGKSNVNICVGQFTQEKIVKVFATSIHMGSASIDAAMADHVFAEIEAKHKNNMKGHAKSYAKVLRECKKAKEMLSSVDNARIQAESLKDDIDVNVSVSRREAEAFAKPLVQRLTDELTSIKEKFGDILQGDVRVESIGSGWRSTFVQDAIKSALGTSKCGVSLDSNLAVAEGAAILGVVANRVTIAPDGVKDDIHNVVLENFTTIETDEATQPFPHDELEVMKAAELELERMDEIIHNRVRAINALDSFILQTLEASYNCTTDSGRQEAIRHALSADEEYVRDDCNGDDIVAIEARLGNAQAKVAADFPEIAAHYAALKDEERKKDEELERLSKLQSEDKELKSDPQRLRGAQQRREQGQNLFKQEHWGEAQTRFVQALAILGELYDTKDPETKKKKEEISLSCHLNISSCSIKLGMWRNALNNATSALELSPNHPKALFRRGQANSMLNEFDAARKDLELAKELSKGDAAVAAELDAVIAKQEASKAKEKKMFAKMFA